MIPQLSRRYFLKTTASAIAALVLPKGLLAKNPDQCFWFVPADSSNSPWAVANPVAWSLENARQPILERASEGLAKMRPEDGNRIIRLLVRRCRLNLLELRPKKVVVKYYGQQGQVDLRPFFKQKGLAHSQTEVVLHDRKKDIITMKHGDDFLYGEGCGPNFPFDLFISKWVRRFEHEADDWQAAPGTRSGYAWEGIEDSRIPWIALKAVWRSRDAVPPLACLNCDTPTILVNFGNPQGSMFNRYPRFISVCCSCCRSFQNGSVNNVLGWMEANLPEELRPDFIMWWNHRMKLERTTKDTIL